MREKRGDRTREGREDERRGQLGDRGQEVGPGGGTFHFGMAAGWVPSFLSKHSAMQWESLRHPFALT